MSDPTRKYELTFDDRPDYLFARVIAQANNRKIATEHLDDVASRATATKPLMLHRGIPSMPPDGVLFFVTAEFQQMISGVGTAFVNPYLSNEGAFNFAITVGTNRGANYKIFNNDADAETWLLRPRKVPFD